MRHRAFVAAAIVVAACSQRSETPEQTAARILAESDSARPTFDAIYAAIGRQFSAGLADSLAALYADHARVMPPNSRPAEGRDAVRQMYATTFQNGPVGQLQLRVEHATVNGPIAVVRAAWVFTPPAGAPVPADTGESIDHLQRLDGRWVIVEEMWRSDLPARSPPPPPRRRG